MSVKKSVNALENFKSSYGCFIRDGAIAQAYSCVRVLGANLPENIKLAAYSKATGKYFVCTESSVYVSENGKNYTALCGCGDFTFTVEDGARTVIISGSSAAVYDGEECTVKTLPVTLSCGVMHCGRLFGADGLTLRWSGAGGFDDWTETLNGSGYLKLDPARGKVLDMLEYGGKLIAVREYGLTVLSMYGSPENFSVDITDTDCDKIYKNTARVVLGKLYFYCDSGLKCFDGTTISIVEIKHFYGTITEPAGAVEYCGKYFLACKSNYLYRKVIMCVDMLDCESCIIDEPAEALYVNDGLFVCNDGGLKKLSDGASYYFESGAINFGTGRLKTVTKIDICGTADIRISSERLTHLYYNASGAIRPHMRGASFVIEVKGKNALGAVNVTAEVTNAV